MSTTTMDGTTTTAPPLPAAATADPAPIPPPLLAFLTQLKLSTYAQALADLGYDDVDFLSIMEKEQLESAADAAKMLPGHKAKFVWALTTSVGGTKLKPAAAPENDDAVLAIVVDRSGSMSSMGSEVMNGYNTFLEEQQKLPGECTATIIRFDTEVEVVHEALALAKIPEATAATFEPRGMTALYDAIGTAIAKVQQQIRALPKPPSRVMIMILTDGAENASKTYTQARISKDIKRLTDKSKWEFVFIGANQDAVHTGASMGVVARNCITFDADKVHAKNAWDSISENCAMYRSPCKNSGFSLAQRTATTSGPSYLCDPSGAPAPTKRFMRHPGPFVLANKAMAMAVNPGYSNGFVCDVKGPGCSAKHDAQDRWWHHAAGQFDVCKNCFAANSVLEPPAPRGLPTLSPTKSVRS